MLPYWFLFGLFAVGAAFYRREPDWTNRVSPALALAALVPIIMIGFRYRVGADWDPYMLIYSDLRYRDLITALYRIDPGYGLLNWLAHRLGLQIWAVNLGCALILVYGLVRFANRQPNPWLAIVVAIPYFVIVVAMGYTRQGAAIGLLLVAFTAVPQGSLVRFIAWTLAACLFHRSAIILLPMVAMSFSRNRVVTIALGLSATLMIFYFIVRPTLDLYVGQYGSSEYESQGTAVRLAMNVVPAILYLGLMSRFPVEGDERTTWRNISIVALVAVGIYLYFGPNTALDRLALYIIPLQIMVLSALPYALGTQGRQSRVVVLGVISYAAAIQTVWLGFAGHASSWLPYRSFLFPT